MTKQQPNERLISKEEFDAKGGFSNPALFREPASKKGEFNHYEDTAR